ncbi:MAG: transposase DNA-binding-containing protein [Segetibacter sp.]
MIELVNSFPDFKGSFGDKRIEKRAAHVLQKLTVGRSSSLRQVTQTEAELKSFYRLFNNESFSEQSIKQSIVKRYKWVEAARQTKELLKQAETITIIADRESDIYDLLAIIDGEKVHGVIRSNFNRKIAKGIYLTDYLDSLPVMHQYALSVRGDVRKGIDKRVAQMGLKWGKVDLQKSKTCKNKELSESKEMYVVEAQETEKSKGIHWRLLTTHPVTNATEAMQIIEWYKQRWYIEQVHGY